MLGDRGLACGAANRKRGAGTASAQPCASELRRQELHKARHGNLGKPQHSITGAKRALCSQALSPGQCGRGRLCSKLSSRAVPSPERARNVPPGDRPSACCVRYGAFHSNSAGVLSRVPVVTGKAGREGTHARTHARSGRSSDTHKEKTATRPSTAQQRRGRGRPDGGTLAPASDTACRSCSIHRQNEHASPAWRGHGGAQLHAD